jgi:purine nucleosidase
MKISRWVICALFVLLLASANLRAAAHEVNGGESVNVILDTDMNLDIDDMLALSMLHAFESRGEAKIIAITCSFQDRWGPSYIDLVDTFYGRPEIPIGLVRNGYRSKGPPLPDGMPLYTQYF